MPPVGASRSNYRIRQEALRRLKGFAEAQYEYAIIDWDSTDPDDRTSAESPVPLTLAQLNDLVAGLNSGAIRDRWV